MFDYATIKTKVKTLWLSFSGHGWQILDQVGTCNCYVATMVVTSLS